MLKCSATVVQDTTVTWLKLTGSGNRLSRAGNLFQRTLNHSRQNQKEDDFTASLRICIESQESKAYLPTMFVPCNYSLARLFQPKCFVHFTKKNLTNNQQKHDLQIELI